jgi:hypothetical protein
MGKIGLFEFTSNFVGDKVDLRKHAMFWDSYPKFMVNRVLSMSPKSCHLAMFMSQLDNIPDEQHFAFLNIELEKGTYFNYYKRSDEIPQKTIDYIQEYYQCSESRCIEYIRMMSKKQIDTILELYKRRDERPKIKKVKKS